MNDYVKKSVLVFLAAKDFNEQEYRTVKSALEHAGLKLFTASDTAGVCIGNSGSKVKPDIGMYNMRASSFAGLIIIGGAGIKKYWDNPVLWKVARDFFDTGKLTAAICKAPVIFARAGILKNTDAVCFPSDKIELEKAHAIFIDQPVVKSKHIITGRNPDAAGAFAASVESFLSTL